MPLIQIEIASRVQQPHLAGVFPRPSIFVVRHEVLRDDLNIRYLLGLLQDGALHSQPFSPNPVAPETFNHLKLHFGQALEEAHTAVMILI